MLAPSGASGDAHSLYAERAAQSSTPAPRSLAQQSRSRRTGRAVGPVRSGRPTAPMSARGMG